MRQYETVCLFDVRLDSESLDKEINKVLDFLKNASVATCSSKKWGRKETAYNLNGQDWAHYVSFNFTSNPEVSNSLTAYLRLNDQIIKFETQKLAETKAA